MDWGVLPLWINNLVPSRRVCFFHIPRHDISPFCTIWHDTTFSSGIIPPPPAPPGDITRTEFATWQTHTLELYCPGKVRGGRFEIMVLQCSESLFARSTFHIIIQNESRSEFISINDVFAAYDHLVLCLRRSRCCLTSKGWGIQSNHVEIFHCLISRLARHTVEHSCDKIQKRYSNLYHRCGNTPISGDS